MDNSQLSKLVGQVRRGDQAAFEELYFASSRSVYFTCVSFLRNGEDAKDVMQEVYVTAYEKLNSLHDAEKFIPWINRIAVNKCKRFLMKKKVSFTDVKDAGNEPVEENENFLPEEYITQKEKRKLVMDIMRDTLSDIQYKTVILYYFNGFPVDEIAEIMECPAGTVRYRLSVARARIRDGVSAYENRSGDKLYSVAGLPLLMRLLCEEAKAVDAPDILREIMNIVGQSPASGTAESASAGEETPAAVESGASGTGETAGSGTGAKNRTGLKIGIAAAVAVMIAVGVVLFMKNRGEEVSDGETEKAVQGQPAASENEVDPPPVPGVDWYAAEEYGCPPFYLKYAALGTLEEKDFSGLMINDAFAYGASLEEILQSYHYFQILGVEGDFTTGFTEYTEETTLGAYEMAEVWCYTEEGNYNDDIKVAVYNLSDAGLTVRECIENDWFVCYAGYCMLGTAYELEDDKREELVELADFLGRPTMVTYDSNQWRDLRDVENETFAETVSKGGGRIDYNLVYMKGDHILSIRIAEDISPLGIIIWVEPIYLTQDVYERLVGDERFSYTASYIMSDKLYDYEQQTDTLCP